MLTPEEAGYEYRTKRRRSWRAGHSNFPTNMPIPSDVLIGIEREAAAYEKGYADGIATLSIPQFTSRYSEPFASPNLKTREYLLEEQPDA